MEPLKDPKNNRVVTSIKPPPSEPLSSELIWYKKKHPSRIIRHAQLEGSKGSPKERRSTI